MRCVEFGDPQCQCRDCVASREQPPSIRCPQCGRKSYNPNDVRERYCGNCHQYHDQMMSV